MKSCEADRRLALLDLLARLAFDVRDVDVNIAAGITLNELLGLGA